MNNSTHFCDANEIHSLTDAWGKEVRISGFRAVITSTGVHLPLGVPTRVAHVVVTTTMQAPGWAIVNVEGPYNHLTRPNLTKLLGNVEKHEARRRNWDEDRGWFTSWVLYGGVAFDETGNVVAPG